MKPQKIHLTIFWNKEHTSMSNYEMYEEEIWELMDNYEYGGQFDLFTYVPVDYYHQWLWDVFAREPCEVAVDLVIW